MCVQVMEFYETYRQNKCEEQLGCLRWDHFMCAPLVCLVILEFEVEQEHAHQDPKDGELCLSRMKLEETLVEVRSDSDVQIDC